MGASTTRLTIPQGQGHYELCPYAYGTGFAACNRSKGAQRRTKMRLFCAQRSGSNGGLSGAAERLAGSFWPVLRTLLSPPPLDRSRGRRVTNPQKESAMSQSTQGAIRPTATVSRPTLEKRVRRALAAKGHYLQKTRFGTDARIELGEYCVLDDHFIPLSADCRLTELARFLGVLADGEIIEADHQWHSVIIQFIDAGAISVPHRFDLLATTEADQESLDAISTGSLKEAVDACMRLISGWRYVNGPDGRALAFNRYNVGLMLDNYPNAGRAIAEALQSGDAHA